VTLRELDQLEPRTASQRSACRIRAPAEGLCSVCEAPARYGRLFGRKHSGQRSTSALLHLSINLGPLRYPQTRPAR